MEGDLYFISGYRTSDEQLEASSGGDEYGMGFERKKSIEETVNLSKIDIGSLQETINELSKAFDKCEETQRTISIDQIKVALGITGSGQVAILGTGVQAGAQASIEVTLKRK